MNISKTKLLLAFFISGFFLFGLTEVSEAADYYVSTTTSTVDGDTFCGGKCTSADTIIIRGGARGDLLLRDFDGNGSYIPILNEGGAASRVVMTRDGSSAGWGVLTIYNCAWVDLGGNNNSSFYYGIKVINDGSPACVGSVWVFGEGNHIKLGYIEVSFDGNTSPTTGDGFNIKDPYLDETSIFDTIEIHHNYVHGSRYAGMYLGMNNPPIEHHPYVANISVHDNLIEDCGAYGITLKGVHSTSGRNYIYNNIIRGSAGGQSTGLVTAEEDNFKFGIGGSRYYGTNGCDIYNNYIEKTVGGGISAGIRNQNVYNNIVCGCGTGNTEIYGHGMYVFGGAARDVHFYDNIIIQPTRYGIFARGTTTSAFMSRNLIGDTGLGEWYAMQDGDLTESTGADANIYYDNVADFNFNAWSDDGKCSNDDFTFGPASTCVSQSGTCCSPLQTCQGGSAVSSSDCPNVCCVGGTCEDAEICNDLVDNDGDGDIDCADADCVADPACVIPVPTCLAQSGNCCEGLFCGGTVVPSSDCDNCCLGPCSFDGTVTCATQGFQCCTNGCQSGYKGYLEDTCPGEEVCCEACYVAKEPSLSSIEMDMKNPSKISVFSELIENTLMWSLSIVGSLALLMLIIGGAMYIGSAGDEQKVLNAKKIVTYTIIGTILILVSYAVIVVVGGILT